VPAFFLDTTEVTVEAFHRNQDNRAFFEKDPKRLDHAVTGVTWDQAVSYAERVGKRLPDEAEYEYAATEGGRRRFPWGNEAPPLVANTWPLGPVGHPKFDRLELPGQPAVFGLYSNVVEWTISWADSYPGMEFAKPNPELRVIRGGPAEVAEGKLKLPQPALGPRERFCFLFATGHQPGLGFRCARSARPRLRPEDFGAVLGR
jgi:formylglycine-generating enzyme required for sulfatase activity